MKYNYRILIAYDGTSYNGWQRQEHTANTIQQIIESTLTKLLKVNIQITGAGRTDSGVHAYEQAANFFAPKEIDLNNLFSDINKELPEDIKIISIKQASERFHSRFNAISKEYIYYLDTRERADVFQRKYSWHIDGKLDCDLMRRAASYLIGTHDYQSFTSDKNKDKSYIRKIHDIKIIREKDKISISIHGNGFLHNMVRIIVGNLVEVGLKERNMEEIKDILEVKKREAAGKTAPPNGLFLKKIYY